MKRKSPSSYLVARRHGPTAHQHWALTQIDTSPDRNPDIHVLTLRALYHKGLIDHRIPRTYRRVRSDDEFYDYVLTEDGKAMLEKLGEWHP